MRIRFSTIWIHLVPLSFLTNPAIHHQSESISLQVTRSDETNDLRQTAELGRQGLALETDSTMFIHILIGSFCFKPFEKYI